MPRLNIKPSFSWYLACLSQVVYLAGVYIVSQLTCTWFISVSLFVVLSGAYLDVLAKQVLLTHPHAVKAYRFDGSRWHVYSRNSGWVVVDILSTTLRWPAIVIVNAQSVVGRKRYTRIVFSDSLSDLQWRQMRCVLWASAHVTD